MGHAALVNIGTLFTFIVVAIGIVVLRRTRPDLAFVRRHSRVA